MKLVSAARLRRAQDAIVARAALRQRAGRRDRRGRAARGRRRAPAARSARARAADAGAADVRPRPGGRLQRQRVPRRAALHRRAEAARRRRRARSRWRSWARRAATSSAAARRPSATSCPGRPRRPRWHDRRSEMAHIVTHASSTGATDAVYLVYNEFKSAVPAARRGRAAAAGHGRGPAARPSGAPTRRDRLPVRAVEDAAAGRAAAAVRRVADLPRPAGVDGVGVRRAHDRDGQRDPQRQGDDFVADRCNTTAPARRRSPRS